MNEPSPPPAAGDDAANTNSDPSTLEQRAAATPPEEPRRNFMTKALAIIIGLFASLFPAVAGLAVFLDPLRKRKKRNGTQTIDGPEGFLKVAHLDGLPVGKPKRFTVIDDLVDAWNFFPEEPVGAVYLLRKSENEVIALNVECPHAGCSVDFNRDRQVYQCPCHASSFKPTGEIANANSPSARGLDSLVVDSEKLQVGEVWIKFQSFHAGTAKKIVVE